MAPILVLTYWSFNDALIQTYTLPYVRIITRLSGRRVYLLCLEQGALALSASERIARKEELLKEGIHLLFFDYHRFGLKQALLWALNVFRLIVLILSKGVEWIHAWCTPAGAIGYILSILTGKPLVVDSYEPHSESMVENGSWAKSSLAYKILFYLERKQSERASELIAVASGMREYAKKTYGVEIAPEHFFIKPACTDLQKFQPGVQSSDLKKKLGLEGKIVAVYAGKLGGIYLNDEVFDLIKQCYDFWGDDFRFLMLSNAKSSEVESHLQRLAMPMDVVILKFVPHAEIPAYISLGDFALNPVKPVPSKRYCTPIKDGEYWATGLPVIITANISDDSDIIEQNDIGYVLKELTNNEYLRAIEKMDSLLKLDKCMLESKIRGVAEKYRSFQIAENIYRKIYCSKL